MDGDCDGDAGGGAVVDDDDGRTFPLDAPHIQDGPGRYVRFNSWRLKSFNVTSKLLDWSLSSLRRLDCLLDELDAAGAK